MNSIEIKCNDQKTLKSTEGSWGSWTMFKYCPNGAYLSGFQLKSQPSPGIECNSNNTCDKVGATDINMKCNDGTVLTGNSVVNWGTWGKWIECPPLYYICGIKTKVYPSCGSYCDDYSLTKVSFICCVP